MIVYRHYESPLGTLLLAAEEGRLTGVWFVGQKHFPRQVAQWQRRDDEPVLMQACEQLEAYFEGHRQAFSLPLAPKGTDFQRKVWQELEAIGFGKTHTYGELAVRLGTPSAARAVGAAVGRNPLSVIVPCHRVLGASGSLTGYAGGVERKRYLLALERGESDNVEV